MLMADVRPLGLAALLLVLLPADTIGPRPRPVCTEGTPTTNVFRVTTLPFTATNPQLDPFDVDTGLRADFTNGSVVLRLRGYWDGNQAWKVRFAAPEPGCWAWVTSCLPRSAGDAGLCPYSGLIRVLPPDKSERRQLYRHGGFLRPSPQGFAGRAHLQYTDGTPFWWLADTLWTVPSFHTPLATFEAAVMLRARQGFTAIQIHGSAGFSPECNVTEAIRRRNVSVFQHMEGYYHAATQNDLVLVVGFSRGDLLTRFPDSKTILPKLFNHHLARFGALPISYLVTQEYNCFTYSTKPDVAELLVQGQLLAAADPYRRSLSMHPAVLRLDTRDAWAEPWYDYALLQQGHLVNNTGVLLTQLRAAVSAAKGMPVINSEANYEGFVRRWNGSASSLSWNWSRAEELNCFEYVDAACVRDTMYTSIQLGLAGFTYGAQGSYYGVQSATQPGPTIHHGPVLTTAQGLRLEGATQLGHAQTFYRTIVGETVRNLLMPCEDCLVGNGAPCCPVALATRHADSFAVYIKPHKQQLTPLALVLTSTRDHESWIGTLYDPRNGSAVLFSATPANGRLLLPEVDRTLDWLVFIQATALFPRS